MSRSTARTEYGVDITIRNPLEQHAGSAKPLALDPYSCHLWAKAYTGIPLDLQQ